MSHIRDLCHVWTHLHSFRDRTDWKKRGRFSHAQGSHVGYKRVISPVWISHVSPEGLTSRWSKEPPHPGGVSYLMCSLIKNPKEEDPPRRICTRCFEGGPLPPDSWLGNIVNRKPPRGGRGGLINVWVLESCQMCMSRVTCNEPNSDMTHRVWMSHVSRKGLMSRVSPWVMSDVHESCHT